MAGVRIQHLSKRNTTMTLVDQSRPYRSPLVCSGQIYADGEIRPCLRTHTFKTYHLNLDDVGATIVSPEIIERLLVMGAIGRPDSTFVIANKVENPPEQRVLVPALRIRPAVIAPGNVNVH